MAPSQHIRSTLGKSRTSRMGFATTSLTVLLGATLALSACGTQPGAAAIVNGTTISDKDVQTVSNEINRLALGDQKLRPSDALLSLILAPYVLAEAKPAGKTVSAAQARKVIAKVTDPSPSTITFVQTQLAIQSLSQAGQQSIMAKLGKAKITVNPRYGTFDAKRGLVPTAPNWIKASTSSGAK